MRIRAGTWLAVAVAVPAAAAFAHHAQAPFFDQDRVMEVDGVVERFDFRNPHPVIYVRAAAEEGGTVVWQVQLAPATWLAKRGWSATTFEPGDEITVRGHPSRQPGTYGLQSQAIIRDDGSEIDAPSERED